MTKSTQYCKNIDDIGNLSCVFEGHSYTLFPMFDSVKTNTL